MSTLDEAWARFRRSEEIGYGHFDGLRLRFVERLLDRAQEREAGRQRLVARAMDRLDALAEDFEAAKNKAVEALSRLEEVPTSLQDLHDAGDFRQVMRTIARRPARVAHRLRDAQARKLEQKLDENQRARTSQPPPAADGLTLATWLYGERSGEALTRRAVEALRVELPEEAGPYHGTTVAADALASLDAHARPLLRAWLQRLRNMDALRPEPTS